MKLNRSVFALMLAALAAPGMASALAAPGMAAAGEGTGEASKQEEQPTDEVVVTGKQGLSKLRSTVWRLEEEFYDRYNELNDDREFDVSCFDEAITGTRVKNQVCRVRFVIDAYSSGAARKRQGSAMDARNNENSEVAVKTKQFEEKMASLIASDPELQDAFTRYNDAMAQYMATLEANN